MIGLLGVALAATEPAPPARPARHFATVIGVGSYSDPAYAGAAESTRADAHAVREALGRASVPFVVSEHLGRLTETEIRDALNSAARSVGPADDLLVYFAGHAMSVPDSRAPGGWDLVLLASDALAGDTAAAGVSLYAAMEGGADGLEGLTTRTPRNLIVIVDACRSVATGAVPARPPDTFLHSAGNVGVWALVYASQPGRPAGDDGTAGFFTSALLGGLTTRDGFFQADADRNGAVTAVEWLLFATSATSARTSGSQRPQALLDVRGAERMVLFGEERRAEGAILWGENHPVRVAGLRGGPGEPLLLPTAGVVPVRIEDGRLGRGALVRLRPGEELRLDVLSEDPPGKLYAGLFAGVGGGKVGSPDLLGVSLWAVPRDLWAGRIAVGGRAGWGVGAVEDLHMPNLDASAGVTWEVVTVWRAARGLDRVGVGPGLAMGVVARWPEAGPEGGRGLLDAASQVGAAPRAWVGAHAEVGRTRVGLDAGVRAPLVDGRWEVEPALAITVERRLFTWGSR